MADTEISILWQVLPFTKILPFFCLFIVIIILRLLSLADLDILVGPWELVE